MTCGISVTDEKTGVQIIGTPAQIAEWYCNKFDIELSFCPSTNLIEFYYIKGNEMPVLYWSELADTAEAVTPSTMFEEFYYSYVNGVLSKSKRYALDVLIPYQAQKGK